MAKRQFTICVCSDLVDAHESLTELPVYGSDAAYKVTKEEATGLCEVANQNASKGEFVPVQVNHGQKGIDDKGQPVYEARKAVVGRITGARVIGPEMLCDIEIDTGDTDAGRILEPLIDSGQFLGVSMSHFFGTDEFEEVSLLPRGARPNTGVIAEVTPVVQTNQGVYTPKPWPGDVCSRLRLNVRASAATRVRRRPQDPITGKFLPTEEKLPLPERGANGRFVPSSPVETTEPIIKKDIDGDDKMAAPTSSPPMQVDSTPAPTPTDQQSSVQEQPVEEDEDFEMEMTDEERTQLYQSALQKSIQGLAMTKRESLALMTHLETTTKQAATLQQEMAMRETKHQEELKNNVDVYRSMALALASNDQQRQSIQHAPDARSLLVCASEATKLKEAELVKLKAQNDLLIQMQQQQPREVSQPKRQRLEQRLASLAASLQNPYSQQQPTEPQAETPPAHPLITSSPQTFPMAVTTLSVPTSRHGNIPVVTSYGGAGVPQGIRTGVQQPFKPTEGTPEHKGPWNGRLVVHASAAAMQQRPNVDPNSIKMERPDANAVVTHPKWLYEAGFNQPMIDSHKKFTQSEFARIRDGIPPSLFSLDCQARLEANRLKRADTMART